MPLSRKAKLVWIGTIATAAIVAITLGITLSPSSRSTEIAKGTSGSAGSVDDTTTGDICPCFNGDDLDNAVTDITSRDPAFVFDSANSCTGEDSDGIRYTQFSPEGYGHLMGFGVRKGYLECSSADMVQIITEGEAAACATLIVDKCAEHKDDLDAAAVVSPDVLAPKPDVLAPKLACPCFSSDDFDSAVTDITSGDPAFAFDSANSCTGGDSDGIKYSRDGHLLGFSVEKGYLMCTNMDMVHSIAQDEATACATLIVDKCAEHKDDLDAVAVVAPDVLAPKISCPCFAASSLDSVITAVLDGSLTLNADSCAETENGRTISYTVQEYYEYHSWGVGTFGSELSCQHADTIRPGISDEEYNACKTIVDDGCTKLEM